MPVVLEEFGAGLETREAIFSAAYSNLTGDAAALKSTLERALARVMGTVGTGKPAVAENRPKTWGQTYHFILLNVCPSGNY